MRRRGYLCDPLHLRNLYVKWAHRFNVGVATALRDLRQFAPYVLDQGRCSGCVGHGTAPGIATCAAAAGMPLGFVPSPSSIYTIAVALERGDPLAHPLQDAGSMPALAMRGLSEFGVRPLLPTGAVTDCFPNGTLLPEPDLAELEVAGAHHYVGWYEIGNADEARVAIAAGAPVGVGTYIDSSFEQWQAGQPPLGRMDQTDPNGGGHWTCLLASETGGRFILRNSWGTGWGDQGEALVTDDFVNQADQLIAFGWKGPLQ